MAASEASGLSFGRLDGLLGFHLRMASAALARDFVATLGDLELTQTQCALLELIAANPGVSQIDMAAALGMDRATTMGVVDRLEARGLVRRTPSRRDRRRQDLELTDAGEVLLAAARRRIAAHERRFADRLGSQRTAQLIGLLREVRAAGRSA